MGTKNWFYRVEFKEPPIEGDRADGVLLSSLAAIYEQFAPEQVGCKVSRLWNIGVSDGVPYSGRRCTITKEQIQRKTQNKPRQRAIIRRIITYTSAKSKAEIRRI